MKQTNSWSKFITSPGWTRSQVVVMTAIALVLVVWFKFAERPWEFSFRNPIIPLVLFIANLCLGFGRIWGRGEGVKGLVTGAMIGALICATSPGGLAAAPPSGPIVATTVAIPSSSISSTTTNVIVLEAPPWVTLENVDAWLDSLIRSGRIFTPGAEADIPTYIPPAQQAAAPLPASQVDSSTAPPQSVSYPFVQVDSGNPLGGFVTGTTNIPLPIPITPIVAAKIIFVLIMVIVAGIMIYKLIRLCQKLFGPKPPATNNPIAAPLEAPLSPQASPQFQEGDVFTTPPPGYSVSPGVPTGFGTCSVSGAPGVNIATVAVPPGGGASNTVTITAAAVPMAGDFVVQGELPPVSYVEASGRVSGIGSPVTVVGSTITYSNGAGGNMVGRKIERAPSVTGPWEVVASFVLPEGMDIRAHLPVAPDGSGFYRISTERSIVVVDPTL